jgi:hypothetical protein
MVLAMRIRVATIAAIAFVALSAAAPAAFARHSHPSLTHAQIQSAVKRALHSSGLWATINICSSSSHPLMLGLRGEMPGLDVPAHLYMTFQVEYWSFADRKFEPFAGVAKTVDLGQATGGLHQAGLTFGKFTPPVVLAGQVTFEWRQGTKVLGRAVRFTGRGYKGVDFSDPAGYTAVTCRIG